MVSKELELILEAINAKFGQDISVFDMHDLSLFVDYYVIVTALNKPNALAIINEIENKMLQNKYFISLKDKYSDSGWLLIETNNVLIHIFHDNKREYYKLEDIWQQQRIFVK